MSTRRLYAWTVGLVVFGSGLPARAEHFVEAEPRRYESPQYGAIEFKLGPYSPNIDSEFAGNAQPYEDLFDGGSALMFRGEIDVQFWGGFGSIGLGVVAGYYSNSAAPFLDDSTNGQPASGVQLKGDNTTLKMFPLAALAVYRFDVLADQLGIPLVPYVKFGLAYTLWSMHRGDGSVSKADGVRAKGGNFGWQLNLGGAFRLDFLEPDAARNLDNEIGVNHTYLLFEMLHLDSSGLPDLSDTTYQGGLAFEF